MPRLNSTSADDVSRWKVGTMLETLVSMTTRGMVVEKKKIPPCEGTKSPLAARGEKRPKRHRPGSHSPVRVSAHLNASGVNDFHW